MADYDAANITDSTDWLATPLSGLSPVESALRCRVCRDFYKTPMITTCLHTFCSLCIRRSLASEGRCPACRAPEQDSKLRWNGALDEAVDAYVKTRPALLSFARAGAQESKQSPKRKLEHESPPDGGEDVSRKRLRSSARLSRTRGEEATAEMVRHEVDVIEDSADEEYEENRDDTLAPCPICNRQMKAYLVFGHLDKCTGPATEASQTSREPSAPNNFLNPSPRKQQANLERLPALNYSTLKDQVLRKKMTDLGISSTGPRVLLERRHREWRTIWNANCDAVRPRPRSQLVRDLEVWERTQGGRVSAASRSGSNSTLIKNKDFDGGAWATKYNSSFKDLVANARRSRPPKQEPNRVEVGQTEDGLSAGVDGHKQEEYDSPMGESDINGQQAPVTLVDDVGPSHSLIDPPMGDSGVKERETFSAPVDNATSPDNASVNVDSHGQEVLEAPVNNIAS